MSTVALKYAEILDPSWWVDDVPSTFNGYLHTVQYDEALEPFEEVHTWETYLTQNNHIWNIDVKDQNENTLKSFAVFSRNGKPVSVPVNYANEKIRFVTEREFKLYQSNAYLLHLITNCDISQNPKDIIWPTQVVGAVSTDPYHWQGDIKQKTHSLKHGGVWINFCTENILHTYNSQGEETEVTHEFYFHTAKGDVNLLKSFTKSFDDKTERQKRLRTRRFYMVEEAKAYTKDTAFEADAMEYFKEHKAEFDNYIETGDTTIITTIEQEDTLIEWWLLEDYELPTEQIVTIQQALTGYLTL